MHLKKTQVGIAGGHMNKYTPIIGLEIHAELKTNSKMFCNCKNDPFGAKKPNIYTCAVCLGMPGGLPIPNKKAIEWTIQLGLALDCQINLFSKFDRKNYFYPDLAKGYQISQYDIPFCYKGKIQTSEGEVGITRIHLEEDTGKLLHEKVNGEEVSLIDFNRSGVPLVEIVSEPDIKTGSQAKEYGKKLRQIMRYLDIAECRMAEGGMRLEANISLQQKGETDLPNYKVEVKNINSFKFLEQAIDFEIDRQSKILDKGETPIQETRGWDSTKSRTFSQRSKEDAADYRYFPDPDIPPIEFTQKQVDQLRQEIPELPNQIIQRWTKDYGVEERYALQLSQEKSLAIFLEQLFKQATAQKIQANQLANDLVNKKIELPNQEKQFTPKLVDQLIKSFLSLHQTNQLDQNKLSSLIEAVLTINPDAVEKYKAGKVQIVGFLMGQIISKLDEKPDPAQIKEALIQKLS